MKKIIHNITKIIVGFLFGLSLFILISGTVAIREGNVPSVFGYSYSIVVTPSMEPTIKTGDLIITKKVEIDEIEIGDVILFKASEGEIAGKHIVHRVIGIIDGKYQTQGDNNPIPDEQLVSYDMVVGEYVFKLPFKNVGLLIIENKSIIFIILIGIFAFMMIMQIYNIYRTLNDEKIKKTQEQFDAEKEALRKQLTEEIKKELFEEQKKGQEKNDNNKDVK